MVALLLMTTLSAAPVIVRVDMQDALRFPSGAETPPDSPLVLFVRAPPTWVANGALTDVARKALLARLYGSADWEKGNSDGSTYVVKSFASRLLKAGERPAGGKGVFWYEVLANGALEKRGVDFGPPAPMKAPVSLVDEAETVFKAGPRLTDRKALEAWAATEKRTVRVLAVLSKGALGFSRRGHVGALEVDFEDTKLGIALPDRAAQFCKGAGRCELWLLGTWAGTAEAHHRFSVSKVEGPPTEGERSAGITETVFVQER